MTVIDADAHVNEDPLAWTELEAAHPGWLSAGRSGGHWVAQIDGKLFPVQEGPGCGVPIDSATSPACAGGAADLDRRLADMDQEGIDVQVLFGGLMIGLSTYRDPGFAQDVARAYNDWLIDEVCGRAPERLKAVAVVPLQDVPRAIDELRRARGKGAVAVTIPPVLGEANLDDPALLPFFEAAAGEDVAVTIHSAPGMNVPLPAAGRFANYAQVHCLSFPVDQMVALTALAMGGVLDRLPGLRVGFMESGIGWVPYFLHRMHEHKEKRPELLPTMTGDPRDHLERGQLFFSFEAEEPLLEVCVERLGADAWVYASDYPHWDSDFPGTVEACRAMAAPLGPEVTAKVLGGNAARLYGLADEVAAAVAADASHGGRGGSAT
ncbi:amidohydrolase family protein [Rhabdothermincola sp.]|uniref:amidohydrolase family protein n=1 Tax=Rhabdothermincola sp. TaxID=2820405 RepID=UPI002FE1E521